MANEPKRAQECAFDARNCILGWCSFLPRWKSPTRAPLQAQWRRMMQPRRVTCALQRWHVRGLAHGTKSARHFGQSVEHEPQHW